MEVIKIIKIHQTELAKIQIHGEETYPYECCGILIGSTKKNSIFKVIEARKVKNINNDNPNRRYNIDPLELIKIEDEIDKIGLNIIGIYHSHPNHPARPSKHDLELAWPNFSYVIVSIQNGVTESVTSWRLNAKRNQFNQEKINIVTTASH